PIEDIDLVMAVGLGQVDPELRICEFEVERAVRGIDHRLAPPGNALLSVEDRGNALIESVLDQRAVDVARRLVHAPVRDGDGRRQKHAEERGGGSAVPRQSTQVAVIEAGCICQQHKRAYPSRTYTESLAANT